MEPSVFTNSEYKENITHATANRPYSLHRTEVPADRAMILYPHWHEEIELLYLEKGSAEFVIEEKHILVKEGEALLIPPNLLHLAKNTLGEECCFCAFLFNPTLFNEAYIRSNYNRFVQPLRHNGRLYVSSFTPELSWHRELLRLLRQILCYYNRQDIDLWELELHGLLYQLWNLYYINYMCSITHSGSYERLYHKLKPSLDFIHAYYVFDITLELLAKQSGLCKESFCRYFKQLTGESAFPYIARYRIRKSCELLLNTDMKITHIASQCGFENISYYNRLFMLYMKCKPSQYRKTQAPPL